MRFPYLALVAAAALSAFGCTKDTSSSAPTNVPVAPAPVPAPVLDGAKASPAAAGRELTLTYFTIAG